MLPSAELLGKFIAGLPRAVAWVRSHVSHVELVVNKVALPQVFFEYLSFPCEFSFGPPLHTHNYPGLVH
jgi:hypothetical protein